MDALNKDVSQCEQASRRFGVDCCTGSVPACCNDGGFPDFARFGFKYCSTDNDELSWDEIRIQIACKDRPVVFSHHLSGTGGHMMVIIGYNESGNQRDVIVLDPADKKVDETTYSYSWYVDRNGCRQHWDDFYDVRP